MFTLALQINKKLSDWMVLMICITRTTGIHFGKIIYNNNTESVQLLDSNIKALFRNLNQQFSDNQSLKHHIKTAQDSPSKVQRANRPHLEDSSFDPVEKHTM